MLAVGDKIPRRTGQRISSGMSNFRVIGVGSFIGGNTSSTPVALAVDHPRPHAFFKLPDTLIVADEGHLLFPDDLQAVLDECQSQGCSYGKLGPYRSLIARVKVFGVSLELALSNKHPQSRRRGKA